MFSPWRTLQGSCVLLLVAFTSLCLSQSGDGDDEDGYNERTTYACEYGMLTLECPAGSVIRIDRANYGRFSLKLCNPQGRTENMDVTCQNVKTTDIVSSECDGHQQCEFRVNNDIFEDPCPGTSKYIEVRHHCSPVENVNHGSSSRPSLIQIDGKPPWSADPQESQPARGVGPLESVVGRIKLVAAMDMADHLVQYLDSISSVPVPENVRVCQRLYKTGFISWSMPRDGTSTVYNKFKLKLRKVNETVTEEREINLGNPENGRYIYELGSDVLSTEFALKAATADGGWGDYSLFVRPETCPIPPEIEPKTSSRSYVPVPRNIHVCQHHQSSNSVVDIFWDMPYDSAHTISYNFTLKYRRVNAAEVEEKEISAVDLEHGAYTYSLRPKVPHAQYEYALKARTANGDWGEYTTFVWPEFCSGPPPSQILTTTTRNYASKKCPKVYREKIMWPEANPQDVITADCPDGMRSGNIRFKCLLGGIWDPNGPEMDNCNSHYLETTPKWKIEESTTSAFTISPTIPVSSLDKAGTLLQQLTVARSPDVSIEADRMFNTVTSLPALSQNMSSELMKITDQRKRKERADHFKESIVNIGSEVLNHKARWQSLDTAKRKSAASALLSTVETTGLLAASTIDVGMMNVTRKPNILMKLMNVDLAGEQEATLKGVPVDNVGSKFNEITIPVLTLKQIGRRKNKRSLPVVLVILSNMSEWLAPSGVQTSFSTHLEVDSSSFIYAGNTHPPDNPRRRVNSEIISASVSDQPVRNLDQPILFLVEHMQTEAVANPKCSFWDPRNSTWSDEGCKIRFTNKTHTACKCNHLTSFAVLMDITGANVMLSSKARFSLEIITYVGCIISVFCLVISWITFAVFKSLDCDRNTIHKHLVFCLMLAQIVLIAGIQQTEPKILCSIIAGLLHFLFLASFAWMCLEGVQLYVMLIEVFESERSRVIWYYLFGYGIPTIIVSVSAGIYPQGYGTNGHCWLTTERGFIWSFVGPALGVIVVNIIMLSIAIYIMVRHSSVSHTMRHKSVPQKMSGSGSFYSMGEPEIKSPSRPELPTWIKGAVVLVVLLGLTWVFGVMYLDHSTVVFAYIFTILNSLQGLFIFIFHCLLNEKVQKEYRRFVRHSSWMPSCVRIHYGGSSSSSVSKEPSSGNVVARFFRGKKKNSELSSSTSNSAKPFLHKEQRQNVSSSDGASSSQITSETGTNNNNRKSSRSSSSQSNGAGSHLPRTHELDSMLGDLSEVPDCSVVDSEYVSEYCRENLRVIAEAKRYSTGSEDSSGRPGGRLYENCLQEEPDRLAALSFESLTKRQSPYVSSSEVINGCKVIAIEEDTSDDEDVDDVDVRRLRASLPAEARPLVTQSESEKVLIKNAINKPREPGKQDNAVAPSMSPSLRDVGKDGKGEESQGRDVLPHASVPNLKFKAGMSTQGALPPVLSSPDKDIVTSLPNLTSQSGQVPCTTRNPTASSSNAASAQGVKRHSSDGHMYFSPFRFSATSDC